MTERGHMPEGLYDAPITAELDHALRALDAARIEKDALDPNDSPRALTRLVSQRLIHALGAIPHNEHALEKQLALTNQILTLLTTVEGSGATLEHQVIPPGERLLAVRKTSVGLGAPTSPPRPELPLSSSDLMVNARHDVTIGREVPREIASADRVDLLCSFLKWSGFRLVQDALTELVRQKPGSLRVLTTAYMSATERRALDALVDQVCASQLRLGPQCQQPFTSMLSDGKHDSDRH